MYEPSTVELQRYFGHYGGRYVPEMLVRPLEDLAEAFLFCASNAVFINELNSAQKNYNGRPSPLYYAENLSDYVIRQNSLHEKSKVFLKLEHLNHTGAHKMNNVLGQALLAKHMGKKKIVAETGAGQHGLATAAACAKFGLDCVIFMGETDIQRQYPNVYSMKLMGARVQPVEDGNKTLKDAVNAALKYWIENVSDTHYILGSALGPFPYPQIVQYFQSIIGKELRSQLKEHIEQKEHRTRTKGEILPDIILACVGGGSNSLGIFTDFLEEKDVVLIGAEAGGCGIRSRKHALRLQGAAKVGISQGYKSYFIQNKDGQLADTHSISAGLDYAGVSPQLAYYHDKGRIIFASATDREAMKSYSILSCQEGITPALESSHALAVLFKLKSVLRDNRKFMQKQPLRIVVNVSGRGDKDLFIAAPLLDKEQWLKYLAAQLSRAGAGHAEYH